MSDSLITGFNKLIYNFFFWYTVLVRIMHHCPSVYMFVFCSENDAICMFYWSPIRLFQYAIADVVLVLYRVLCDVRSQAPLDARVVRNLY